MMQLCDIIVHVSIVGVTGRTDIPVSGLQFDSRKVMPETCLLQSAE